MSSLIVFSGELMRGLADHWRLEGASFLEEVYTAPCYRLFSIDGRYPALLRDDLEGGVITAELYIVPDLVWVRVRAALPRGIYRGPIELADGRLLEGELGEYGFISQYGIDISIFGSWRAYLDTPRERTV